jgi:hypothetical protein
MPSQRIVLGIGLAVLLVVSAASIGFDVKSRSDAAWVDHTFGVLKKLSDVRLLTRRAESAARGFVLTNDPNLVKDFPARLDLDCHGMNREVRVNRFGDTMPGIKAADHRLADMPARTSRSVT